MKKLTSLILAVMLAVSLCACGNTSASATGSSGDNTSEGQADELTLQEVSGIVAVERLTDYMNDTLANPDSFEILSMESVECRSGTFAIKLEYSAENRMGGKDRDTVYLKTSGILLCACSLFEDNPISASSTLTSIVESYNEAIEEGVEVVELDVDKILKNVGLDEEVRSEIFDAYRENT